MAGTPQEVAQRWSQRLGGSTDKIRQGVQAVQVSPGQLAARQAQVWQQNTAAAVQKYAANSARVSLQDWQSAMLDKGLTRIGAGATAAEGKMAEFLTSFLPFVENVRRNLPARGNLDANINRMVANARAISAYKRS